MANRHGQGKHPAVPPGIPNSAQGQPRQPQGVQRESGRPRDTGPRPPLVRRYDPNDASKDIKGGE